MHDVIGGEPSTTIALVDTTIGKCVPSRRTPVTSHVPWRACSCPAVRAVSKYSASNGRRSSPSMSEPGRPTISAALQPKISSAAALYDSTLPSDAEGEDPLGGVLHHGPVQRLAAPRVFARARQEDLGALLALTDRAGHHDDDAERERAEESERLRRRRRSGTTGRFPGTRGTGRCRTQTSDQPSTARHDAGPDCCRSTIAAYTKHTPSAGPQPVR